MSFGKLREVGVTTENLEKSSSPRTGNVDAFLGKGSKAVGAVSFAGPAEIDGEVEGEIHSKDRLSIGESAMVKAKIFGAEVIIKGTVSGDVTATRALILKRPAKVTGNITAPNLSIEEGVIFEGKCTMLNSQSQAASKPLEKVSGS